MLQANKQYNTKIIRDGAAHQGSMRYFKLVYKIIFFIKFYVFSLNLLILFD